MTFFVILIAVIILQRIAELRIAKRNEKIAIGKGAVEYDKNGYKYIVLMHTLFLVSIVVEFIFFNRTINTYWYIFLLIYLLVQVLRYWCIFSLGVFWNTKILVVHGGIKVNKGPYKYFKHPNYAVVAAEILIIPLIFSCYFTTIIFSIINLFVLNRRIKIENTALLELKAGQ